MAIPLIDGFDTYNGTGTNTGLQAKWTPVSIVTASPNNASMTTGRFSGQAARIAWTGGGGERSGGYSRLLPSTYSSFTLGTAFRISTLTNVATTALPGIMHFREGTTYHLIITLTSDGKLNVYRASSASAGTLLGSTAAGTIIANTWHYIEAEVVINDSTGRVTLYVDGVQVLNLTSQDTRNGGTGVVDTINISGNTGNPSLSTPSIDFDDLYFRDSATRLGERRVETLYPNSDVAQGFARSAGSTNYTLENEAQVDGDTTYVQGSTVGDVDTYGMDNLSSNPTTIDAVQISAYARKTDAASRSIALQVKSGATTSDGSNYALAASYSKFERILETDPNTGSAWTRTNVDALQGGPKVTV